MRGIIPSLLNPPSPPPTPPTPLTNMQAELDGSNEMSDMIPSLATTQRMAAEADSHQLLVHNGDIRWAAGSGVGGVGGVGGWGWGDGR